MDEKLAISMYFNPVFVTQAGCGRIESCRPWEIGCLCEIATFPLDKNNNKTDPWSNRSSNIVRAEKTSNFLPLAPPRNF